MAGKSELDVEISPAGEVKIHIRGIKGQRCLELMKKIEKELGSVSEQKPTSEYYEQPEEARIHRSM